MIRNLKYCVSYIAWAVILLVLALSHVGAKTSANTIIQNQATLTYFDSVTGLTVTVVSQTSEIVVAELYQVSLVGDQTITRSAGSRFILTHQIENTGNIADRYSLTVSNLTGDSGNANDLILYHDLNGNGIVDPAEPEIDETPIIQPGQSLQLIVEGSIPDNTASTSSVHIAIDVESINSPAPGVRNVDIVDVIEGAVITLNKLTDPVCSAPMFPGETINYTIEFQNTGEESPSGSDLIIDGIPRSGVVIRDVLPEETLLNKSQVLLFDQSLGVPVVQRNTDGDNWITFDVWDESFPVQHIGLFILADDLNPGRQGSLGFEVQVDPLVSPGTIIENTASVTLKTNEPVEYTSNTVCNTVAAPASAEQSRLRFIEPALALRRSSRAPDFYQDSDFVDVGIYRLDSGLRPYDIVRDGVYLELRYNEADFRARVVSLDNSSISVDDDGNRFAFVFVESQITGDTLNVVVLETAPNSGRFRSVSPIRLSTNQSGAGRICPGGSDPPIIVQPDYGGANAACVLQSSVNDTLDASFTKSGSARILADVAIVDPFGMVFDSSTLLPVENATIMVFDRATGRIARDPISDEELILVTGTDGRYLLPSLIPDVQYFIDVKPPPGFSFPSSVSASAFSSLNVGNPSYGSAGGQGGADGYFSLALGGAPVLIDIPLDPVNIEPSLFLDKRALQTEVEPGEIVAYEISLGNRSADDLDSVVVVDTLPYGYRYVSGSAELDGIAMNRPGGGSGPVLEFNLGALAAGANAILTYALEATAGAIDSDGINRAVATGQKSGGGVLVSSQGSARVKLNRRGVLSDQAALFGKVYIDADCNNLHDKAEWPIGGVKLYMEDGTFAITDENGQYSLYGLRPGNHVLKIDPLSMPEGLPLKPLDNRHGADGDSRFVDLVAGDFHRADFATLCPSADVGKVFDEVRERNQAINGDWLLAEAERFNPFSGNPNDNGVDRSTETDGDLSNGVLNGPDAGRAHAGQQQESRESNKSDSSSLPESGTPVKESIPDPAEVVKTITAAQAKNGTWLWPTDDKSRDGRFMAVIRAGVTPMLLVNGVVVPNTQLGEQIVNKREQAQVVAWYGVTLNSGINKVEVRGQDAFGNTRILATGSFIRPSMGSRMVLRAKQDSLPADGGRSTLPIEINILDENDYPAQGVYFVTLDNSDGSWLEEDIQSSEPGHQVKVVDGRSTVHFRSSDFTGTVRLRARTNDMQADMRIIQIASLRPLFGIGLLEFGTQWGNVRGGEFEPTDQADGLDKDFRLKKRASLFLKGKVRGNMQLTLSYDSEKARDTDLLRDINPNVHYPLHGDASIRGYEAQSRSKLYAKLERGKNSLMWGDYLTDSNTGIQDLGRVQQTLTGFNGLYDGGDTRFQLFAARSTNTRVSEELRGNGTSMLYQLSGAPIVINSEVIEVIVRDRNNPGRIISTDKLSRFGDYVIDSMTGQLRFSNVVPGFDEDLNPVFVRISYDQAAGSAEHTVAGIRAGHSINEDITVGVSHTSNNDKTDGNTISGAYLQYKPDDQTSVVYGVGRMTHKDGRKTGLANRLAIDHDWRGKKTRQTELEWSKAQKGFDNPGTGVSAGREELRLSHQRKINASTIAVLEAIHSRALSNQERSSSIRMLVDKSWKDWTLSFGARRINQKDSAGSDKYNTAIVGAEKRTQIMRRPASVQAELEQDISRGNRQRIALASEVNVHEHAKLHGRYERHNRLNSFNTFGASQSREEFSLGVESDYFSNTRMFSEYRMRGAIDSRDYETGSGIRGNFELSPGLAVTPSLEVINVLKGNEDGDAVAVSVGVSDTRKPDAKISGNAEFRKAKKSDYTGLRGSYVARANLDWTVLLREEFTLQKPDEGEQRLRHVFSLGFARRPRRDNQHHMLFMYNWKEDLGPEEGADRTTHMLSTHQNFEYGQDLTFSGRLGWKWQVAHLDSGKFGTSAFLLDGRLGWEMNRRLDLDFRAGLLDTGKGDSTRSSLGLGVSYLVDRNLRFSAGYNLVGFRDSDLDPEGYNANGFQLGFQYKFDEDLFDWLQD